MKLTLTQSIAEIKKAQYPVFLTGAGISTPSGIPDYRSLKGVYHGLENPEYYLSRTCFKQEPEKFYEFVKHLYHPKAKPNVIHEKIAFLTQKSGGVISQNIDGLHELAKTNELISFHGNIYDVYCTKCQEKVNFHEYLHSDIHKGCQGRLRPNIILYEENLPEMRIIKGIEKIKASDLLIVVGTSLKVYPFAGLILEKKPQTKVLIINKEMTDFSLENDYYQGAAEELFQKI